MDDLINIHRKIKFDFILALSEAETLALSKRQDIFQTLNIKTSTSSHETVGKIVDKNLLYDELIRATFKTVDIKKSITWMILTKQQNIVATPIAK